MTLRRHLKMKHNMHEVVSELESGSKNQSEQVEVRNSNGVKFLLLL